MEWIKKHVDTAIVLGAFLAHFYWIDGKFDKISERLSNVEKEVSLIKAVMILKNVMPAELAKVDGE